MTRLDLDPEVLADLRHREASERDRSRSRTDPYAWSPPTIVEHWPCRGGCNAMVGVTRDAVEALATSNAMLARRKEQPIAKSKVVWCDDCKRRDEDMAQLERNGNSRRRMT